MIILYIPCFLVVLVLSNILMNSDQSQCLNSRKSFLYTDTVGNFLNFIWYLYLGFLIAIVVLAPILLINKCRGCGRGCDLGSILGVVALVIFLALKPLWLIIEGFGFLGGIDMQYCSSAFTAFFVSLFNLSLC